MFQNSVAASASGRPSPIGCMHLDRARDRGTGSDTGAPAAGRQHVEHTSTALSIRDPGNSPPTGRANAYRTGAFRTSSVHPDPPGVSPCSARPTGDSRSHFARKVQCKQIALARVGALGSHRCRYRVRVGEQASPASPCLCDRPSDSSSRCCMRAYSRVAGKLNRSAERRWRCASDARSFLYEHMLAIRSARMSSMMCCAR